MLIGYVHYYDEVTGRRVDGFDVDVAAEYARQVSGPHTVAVWSCSNGDPSDVRHFMDGRQLSIAQIQAWHHKASGVGRA